MATTTMNHRRRSPHSHPLNLATANLQKGATFHSPTSTASPASPSDRFIIPRLSRSYSSPDDVIDAHRRRAAILLSRLDKDLLGMVTESTAPTESSDSESSDSESDTDDVLPVPHCFLGLEKTITMNPTQGSSPRRRYRLPQTTKTNHSHGSDSGLGSSLASTKQQQQTSQSPAVATKLVSVVVSTDQGAGLGQHAVNRIHEHILKPLNAKPSLKPFEQIIMAVPRCIRERQIVCLRDLEKTLWFKAQVSSCPFTLSIEPCVMLIIRPIGQNQVCQSLSQLLHNCTWLHPSLSGAPQRA